MSKWIDNWFSNYKRFDTPLIYQNITFLCPENFYQAMKTRKDLIEIRKQLSLMSPGKAKKFWRIKKNKDLYFRDDWFDINHDVMEYVLRYKFARGTSWYKRLREEKGPIIEHNNWHDNYWGACNCEKCKSKTKHNYLGKLLMKLNKEFYYEEVSDGFQSTRSNRL
jgi:predicted NAD-dependent protein-ADP-ribosyltransferase YbiA (DUF1768 family)